MKFGWHLFIFCLYLFLVPRWFLSIMSLLHIYMILSCRAVSFSLSMLMRGALQKRLHNWYVQIAWGPPVHLPTLRFCVYGSLWSLSVGQTQPIEHYLAMHLITWSAFPTIWYEMHLTFICFLGWLEHQLINWGWKCSSHPKIKPSTDLDGFFMCFLNPIRISNWGWNWFFLLSESSGDYGWIARTCWKWKGGRWGLAGPQQNSLIIQRTFQIRLGLFLRLGSSNFGFVVIEFHFDKNMELTKKLHFQISDFDIFWGLFFKSGSTFPSTSALPQAAITVIPMSRSLANVSKQLQTWQMLGALSNWEELGIIAWKMAA